MHVGIVIFKKLSEYAKEIDEVPYIYYEDALDRLKYALKAGTIPIPKGRELKEKEFALTFMAERSLLANANHPYLTNRVAIAYAKSIANTLTTKELMEIAELLGINIKGDKIHVGDFLRYSPNSKDYSLYYFEVHNGYVKLNEQKLRRIIEEVIKKKLSTQPKGKDERIKDMVKELLEAIPKKKVTVHTGEMAPCMKELLNRLRRHENLSHYARWSLAVYLINRGVSVDDIVKLYSALPDYKEEITRYQVEHIKKKAYTTPSCLKMKTYGLCVAECGIKNPMEYGKHGKHNR